MKKLLEGFKVYWKSQTSIIKFLIILFIVLFGVLIWSNWNTYSNKTEITKVKERENLILKTRLEEQREITKGYKVIVDSLTIGWENFNVDSLEIKIKTKYDEKRNAIINQPIDSTINALSKWLKH